jgi:hypothetical protein
MTQILNHLRNLRHLRTFRPLARDTKDYHPTGYHWLAFGFLHSLFAKSS